MAEVYTISGPDLGRVWSAVSDATALTQLVARVPTGAKPAAPVSPVKRLQNALRSLGATKGDPTLSKLKVDGVVGPGTTKAVNYAIAQRYVVMPSFPRPELTVQHVRQYAAGIAAAVEAAVMAGGGTLAPVAEHAPRARGGGIPAALPSDLAPAPESDRKWVWWVVGGLGVLVVLGLAAKAVRGKKSTRRRPRDDDED